MKKQRSLVFLERLLNSVSGGVADSFHVYVVSLWTEKRQYGVFTRRLVSVVTGAGGKLSNVESAQHQTMHPVPASRFQFQATSQGRGANSSPVREHFVDAYQERRSRQTPFRTSGKRRSQNPPPVFLNLSHVQSPPSRVKPSGTSTLSRVNGVIFVFLLQWCLSQIINTFDDVKFEAASVLAELYEQQQQSNLSKPILRKAIELSQHSVYWHCRLIFQLAVSTT